MFVFRNRNMYSKDIFTTVWEGHSVLDVSPFFGQLVDAECDASSCGIGREARQVPGVCVNPDVLLACSCSSLPLSDRANHVRAGPAVAEHGQCLLVPGWGPFSSPQSTPPPPLLPASCVDLARFFCVRALMVSDRTGHQQSRILQQTEEEG